MAIDRIPGVGPQNTDIATAVAAAVPTIAAITSSITTNAASAGLTNASITSAGNAAGWGATGPTTTQIAAAVPTLAQITSAVTTNAASAGVTMAAITSTVQANAGSPYGGTYTNIASTITSSVTSVTITGLSGYKYLKFRYIAENFVSNNFTLLFRINADSSSLYRWCGFGFGDNTTQPFAYSAFTVSEIRPQGSLSTTIYLGEIIIPENNATINHKSIYSKGGAFNGRYLETAGTYASSSAVSSVTFINGSNDNNMNWNIQVWGAN